MTDQVKQPRRSKNHISDIHMLNQEMLKPNYLNIVAPQSEIDDEGLKVLKEYQESHMLHLAEHIPKIQFKMHQAGRQPGI